MSAILSFVSEPNPLFHRSLRKKRTKQMSLYVRLHTKSQRSLHPHHRRIEWLAVDGHIALGIAERRR